MVRICVRISDDFLPRVTHMPESKPSGSGVGTRLAGLAKGASGVVHSVLDGNAALENRLAELGFVVGERFQVVAEAWPSRDPIVVQIGTTTLALRRREAAAVAVELDRRV